jgi:DNA helicase II / ATP-dependent DNA helicase PcrA
VISDFLAASIKHLVVDEVFDGNRLDLHLVAMACNANIEVTLLGDPWQALYRFRGANPELVPNLIQSGRFLTLPLSHSFRFESSQMQSLTSLLRNRCSVSLPAGQSHDVVLASNWDALWSGPDHVLPLSFGRAMNKTDAAAIVLLDHIVHSRFLEPTIFLTEALLLLELDVETYRSEGASVFGNVIDALRRVGGGPDEALRALRNAVI